MPRRRLREIWQRACRRTDGLPTIGGFLRLISWRLRGSSIGPRTRLPRLLVTWPHKVKLGADCIIEPDVYFKHSGFWSPGHSIVIEDRVFIGRGTEFNITHVIHVGPDALIASGCFFIDADHGMARGIPMNVQPGTSAGIAIGANVWIGANCVVLKGVSIGDGSVLAASSVATRSIPAGELWGGVPARKLKSL